MTDLPTSTDDVDLLLERWSSAELRGDIKELDDLLAPDFIGVGPLGFLLTRADWLERHREHALADASHAYDEVTVRRRAGCVVVVARLNADGAWQGHPVPAVLRVSLVLVPGEHGGGRSRSPRTASWPAHPGPRPSPAAPPPQSGRDRGADAAGPGGAGDGREPGHRSRV